MVCFTSFNKGYGHMMHQLRCLEMQPYTVEPKFCHLTGNANQTAWYVNWSLMVIELIEFYWLYEIVNSIYLNFFSWLKLLIGTSNGCIKAWNVDAKRVVCDLNTTEAFPRYFLIMPFWGMFIAFNSLPHDTWFCSVLDIKCSPVEPIFVSAAASGGYVLNFLQYWILY